MNRDHSVVFEIASKYYILDSFVDHDGYSISSERFLPAVRPSAAKKKKKNSPREPSEVSREARHEKGWNQSGSDIIQVMEKEATACFHRELEI